ncbi:hypothetical protein [Pseudoalteromonas phage vB_PtuP_Slicky01]|nr:hypothetical protein [Pseudoalteromonas phage vB_PtuP_Slicky01]
MAINDFLKKKGSIADEKVGNIGGNVTIGGNIQPISTPATISKDTKTNEPQREVTTNYRKLEETDKRDLFKPNTGMDTKPGTIYAGANVTGDSSRFAQQQRPNDITDNELPGTNTGGVDTTSPTVTGTPPATNTETEAQKAIRAQLENPVLADNAKQTYTPITEQAGEMMDSSNLQIKGDYTAQQSANLTAATASVSSLEALKNAELAATGQVSPLTASKYEAAKAQELEATKAIQGTVSTTVSAVTGTLSSGAMAEAAIQDLDKLDPRTVVTAVTKDIPNEALVKGQLDGLLSGLETGKVPLWAQPAVAQAEAMLASRGMSTSSVGKQAMFNAIISSAMPIAQQDAQAKLAVFQQNLSNEQQASLANSQFFQNMTAQNLSNKQQTALANAATIAQMDMANADRAQQAQIANAQNFLQMDIANMNNKQQAAILDSQLKQQTILSNQSAENAAKQFNASSEQQANQFTANLEATVSQFNATQTNAMNQFNTQQSNSMSQFNSQLGFNREQFNVQNATVIEQSNVNWRRQINQANTAGVNAVNQANAMNQFNLSNQALTFLWQEMRDNAKWAQEAGQNEEERKTRMAIAALGNEAMADAGAAANITALAKAAAGLFDSWMSKP